MSGLRELPVIGLLGQREDFSSHFESALA